MISFLRRYPVWLYRPPSRYLTFRPTALMVDPDADNLAYAKEDLILRVEAVEASPWTAEDPTWWERHRRRWEQQDQEQQQALAQLYVEMRRRLKRVSRDLDFVFEPYRQRLQTGKRGPKVVLVRKKLRGVRGKSKPLDKDDPIFNFSFPPRGVGEKFLKPEGAPEKFLK
jgi:hypothetical protein